MGNASKSISCIILKHQLKHFQEIIIGVLTLPVCLIKFGSVNLTLSQNKLPQTNTLSYKPLDQSTVQKKLLKKPQIQITVLYGLKISDSSFHEVDSVLTVITSQFINYHDICQSVAMIKPRLTLVVSSRGVFLFARDLFLYP